MRNYINMWFGKYDAIKIIILWGLFIGYLVAADDFFFIGPSWLLLSGGYFRMISATNYDGKGYFEQPFSIMHAGSAMDQPTIGKYLFWFLFISIAASIISMLIRATCNLANKRRYWLFAIPFLYVMLTTLSFLLIPATWLTHYICDMGMTSRRLFGMIFILVSVLAWFYLAYLLLWRHRSIKDDVLPVPSSNAFDQKSSDAVFRNAVDQKSPPKEGGVKEAEPIFPPFDGSNDGEKPGQTSESKPNSEAKTGQ